MKNLLLIALLVPCLCYGQKFEISEQAGYSGTIPLKDGRYLDGFTNQVAVRYHVMKYFAVGAFYEYNAWRYKNHTFGIAPEFTTRHFFAGIDVFVSSLPKDRFQDGYDEIKSTFTPTIGYGAHIGAKQRIYKRLSLIEQVGYNRYFINRHSTYDTSPTSPYPFSHTYSESQEWTVTNLYIRGGLSYQL